jgi:uncharacterized protein (TIGR00255 family)
MTGYGRATRQLAAGSVTVELRSTNHRYLEIEQRIPNGFTMIQGRLAELVRAQVRRGRIELSIAVQTNRWDRRRVTLDEPLLRRYHQALAALQKRLALKGSVSLDHLLALPQAVTVSEDRSASEQWWELIRKTTLEALGELVRTRRREGERLLVDLRRQLQTITQHLRQIRTRLPKALKQQQAVLRARLQELLGPQASGTMGQLEEAVALVKEADVHEELVRLDSHLVHIRQTLAAGVLVGKRLDFIAQELTREANTLGAKVNDPDAARHVIAIKGCIERIREQVQNLE